MGVNGHSARTALGRQQSLAKECTRLATDLTEALELLQLVTESSGWDKEAGDKWADRWIALKERTVG